MSTPNSWAKSRSLFLVVALLAMATVWPDATATAQGRVFLPLAQTPSIGVTAPVSASVARGVLDGPALVSLATASSGALIRYTVDGSVPGPSAGSVYDAPILVTRTTVLRAVALRDRFAPSAVGTWTYVLPETVIAQGGSLSNLPSASNWPSTWGRYAESHMVGHPVPADYAIDRRVADAATLGAALRSLPSVALAVDPRDLFDERRGIYANPLGRGQEWERAVSVEWLPRPGTEEPDFQINAGLRIAGNASRKHVATPKKNFSLRFTSRHGPTKLVADLFPSSRVNRFDSLRLRGVFNDSFLYVPERGQYLRDRWSRESQLAMGMLGAQGRFAHVYLNGLYWGVYDVSEEPTDSFMAAHRGGARANWDVVEPVGEESDGAKDGNRDAFDALLRARDQPGAAGVAAIGALLDITAYADFTLLSLFVGNGEIGDNWRAARRKDALAAHGFVFFVWDYEGVLDLLPPLHRFHDPVRRLDVSDIAGVGGLHMRLLQSDNYRRLFADRAQRHLGPGGSLSAPVAAARYRALAAELDQAIIAESARWGDAAPRPLSIAHGEEAWSAFWKAAGPGQPQTREGQWLPEVERLAAGIIPSRPQAVISQLCRAGLFPRVRAPLVEARGRVAARPSIVDISSNPAGIGCVESHTGVAWYTMDGTDPRASNGGFAAAARPAAGAVRLPTGPGAVQVLARARHGAEWSTLVERSYGVPHVTIDEIHFHPPGDENDEFLELLNHEPVSVDLSGWRLRGVGLTLPPGTTIPAGGRLVLARNPKELDPDGTLWPPPVPYPGRLANDGERLTLETPGGTVVFAATYDDDGFWPLGADGHGFSLVWAGGPSPAGDIGSASERWRGSRLSGGSPGAADPEQPGLVVISEVLADAPKEHQAIELHAPHAPVDVSGWPLSARWDAPVAARLPNNLVVPRGGHVVISRHALSGDLASLDALFGPHGGEIVLQPLGHDRRPTGDARGIRYGAHGDGVSWGRVDVPGGPHFAALERPTLGGAEPRAGTVRARISTGQPNAAARVGPVVISEMLIAPGPYLDPAADEFVEILNTSTERVSLAHGLGEADEEAWSFVDGISFTFPPGAMLGAHGRMLVVGGDPIAFRSRHAVPRTVAVLGPFGGRLSDDGERVALARPGESGPIVVDEVHYGVGAPWPSSVTDGTGHSLERVDPSAFGSDPRAWVGLSMGGTPGRLNAANARVWLPLGLAD